MADLEMVVFSVWAGYEIHKTKDPEYKITTSTAMLGWKQPVEAQQVAPNMWRVGAIGDGNCMIHSMLFAASPSYRQEDNKHRALIADKFRGILNTRVGELKTIANSMYAEIGGWEALAESFNILTGGVRSEVNLEMGPVIARLYKLNFLAVHIVRGVLTPLVQTYNGGIYEPALPTVLVNYRSWQLLDIGMRRSSSSSSSSGSNKSSEHHVANHYEVIVAGDLQPKPLAPSSKKSRRKKNVTYLFSPDTTYTFRPADPLLAPLMVEFERPGKEFKKEEEAQRIRARAVNVLEQARAATAAAGATAMSPPKLRSKSRSGSGTRKRPFASKSSSKTSFV